MGLGGLINFSDTLNLQRGQSHKLFGLKTFDARVCPAPGAATPQTNIEAHAEPHRWSNTRDPSTFHVNFRESTGAQTEASGTIQTAHKLLTIPSSMII